jgi:hypothetical protein
MWFGKRCSSPFVTSPGTRMLSSACAAPTRLLNDLRARDLELLESSGNGSCGVGDAAAVGVETVPAARVAAAATPTLLKNARRDEPRLCASARTCSDVSPSLSGHFGLRILVPPILQSMEPPGG